MFRIGAFSKLTRVSVRMLRYYDEAGLLRPAQTDPFTGYRLYFASQIPLLNKILFLRDIGCTVSEIAVALERWEDAYLLELLDNKRQEAEDAIREQRQRLSVIGQAKGDVGREKGTLHYNVSIRAVPSYKVLSLRRTVADYYCEGQLWKELSAFVHLNKIDISSDTFTIYHDTDYREQDVDMELCAPVAKLGESRDGFVFRETEAVPIMACTMVMGPFENIAGAYRAFAGWLQSHGQYSMVGQSRQIVLRGPWNEESPGNYLTEIQIPLADA